MAPTSLAGLPYYINPMYPGMSLHVPIYPYIVLIQPLHPYMSLYTPNLYTYIYIHIHTYSVLAEPATLFNSMVGFSEVNEGFRVEDVG